MPLILIIEDHAALARLYQTVLEGTDCRVELVLHYEGVAYTKARTKCH